MLSFDVYTKYPDYLSSMVEYNLTVLNFVLSTHLLDIDYTLHHIYSSYMENEDPFPDEFPLKLWPCNLSNLFSLYCTVVEVIEKK